MYTAAEPCPCRSARPTARRYTGFVTRRESRMPERRGASHSFFCMRVPGWRLLFSTELAPQVIVSADGSVEDPGRSLTVSSGRRTTLASGFQALRSIGLVQRGDGAVLKVGTILPLKKSQAVTIITSKLERISTDATAMRMKSYTNPSPAHRKHQPQARLTCKHMRMR